MGVLELRRSQTSGRGRVRTSVLGFSLIELIVSIAVVALLIAIAIPALSGARASARSAVCLSNLRGVGQIMELYLARYAQKYPFASAGQNLDVSPDGTGAQAVSFSDHFNFANYWVTTMHEVAPWPQSFSAWVCPGSPRVRGEPWRFAGSGGVGIPSYKYASGFMADPRVWSGVGSTDPKLLRAVAASEIAFPSSKCMMWDEERAHQLAKEDHDPTLDLFADGHASVHRLSEASAPVQNPFTGLAKPLADTARGAGGVDY